MHILYNINIKIIGDIWENQIYHDNMIESFEYSLKMLLNTPHYDGLRGNLNFKYYADTKKFEIVSFPEKYDGRIRYLIDINSVFRKKFF